MIGGSNGITLRLLGAVEIGDAEGSGISALEGRQKRISVLAYLGAALPYGFHRRDNLLGLFWADKTQSQARKALNQSLLIIRDAVGEKDVVLSRGDAEVALNEEFVRVDVREFDAAMKGGDYETAIELYRGDFLDGFYIPAAPEFERWADEERTRLRHAALKAAFSLVDQYEKAGEYLDAVERSRWAVRMAPVDEGVFRQYVELLDRHGDRSSALKEYTAFVERLADDYGVDPSPETQALVERIRSRVAPQSEAMAAQTSDAQPPDRERDELLKLLRQSLTGKYEVLEVIGRGGMAIVFKGRDLTLDREVAIKVLRPQLAQSIAADRFLQEIQVEAAIEHPNVIAVYDSGSAADIPYYVMQYVEGETLRGRMKRERQLGIDDALKITRDVASALQAAHDKGFVHRDIQPDNILLKDGHAVVTDFGIARALTEAGAVEFTVTGMAIGTPGYMSPEQAMGDPVDHRSDQYALACVLYEMLTGEMVFSGPTARAIIAKHISVPATPVSVLRQKAVQLDSALLKALEKTAADRFGSISEFAVALEDKSQPLPLKKSVWDHIAGAVRANRAAAALVAIITLVVGGLAVKTTAEGPTPAWGNGRPESVVVLPFTTTHSDDATLVTDIADQIARELNWWNRVRAVGAGALSGITYDLGFSGPAFQSSDAALRVARAADAQALVGISVLARGDSLVVDAAFYDVHSGNLLDRSVSSSAEASDRNALVTPIVFGVLGIGVGVADPRMPGTSDPDALVHDVEGIQQLSQARLDEAEAHFRSAVALDSTYALALTHLALTLFWQAVDGPRTLAEVGPEIAQRSTRAMGSLGGLTERDSLHVRAFYAFQLGEYEEAREHYRAIVNANATDVYAWLMLGATEVIDPWLYETRKGRQLPRRNLSQALRAFTETIRIQPTFELGYGRFLEVVGDLDDAVDLRACPGFEVPRDELIAPWKSPDPQQMRFFCPLMRDSVVWVTRSVFDTVNDDVLEETTERLFQQSVEWLERWADFAPSAPRPREALSRAIAARRSRLKIASPERLRALAAEALDHAAAGLALRGDTTPQDLIWIGNLYLGTGQLREALTVTRQGLSRYRETDMSGASYAAAANVFIAAGQPTRALPIVVSRNQERRIRDPANGEFIAYAGAEPAVERLKVFSATGVVNELWFGELRELVVFWRSLGLSQHEQEILRNDVTLRVASGFAQDDESASYWDRYVSVDHPLWRALRLVAVEPTVATAQFILAMEAATPSMTRASRAFVLGATAHRLGQSRLAAGLLARLDSLPHRLDAFDMGWGLQAVARRLRADALRSTGNDEQAATQLRFFVDGWKNADSLTSGLVQNARAVLSQLEDDVATER